MAKIICNEGPRATSEPSRETPILVPKINLGGLLGLPVGGSLRGPLIANHFGHSVVGCHKRFTLSRVY